jgi:hypothetical protein
MIRWLLKQWWKFWFLLARKALTLTNSRSVVNHKNYVPLFGWLNSFAYMKHHNFMARFRRLNCRCGLCEALSLPFP